MISAPIAFTGKDNGEISSIGVDIDCMNLLRPNFISKPNFQVIILLSNAVCPCLPKVAKKSSHNFIGILENLLLHLPYLLD